MKLGIVGLPNVGKSTLFNAITDAGAQSANYPFCTIEPNIGVVAVPDKRLDKLAEMYDPDKYTPASIEFVDIAGLVKGASKGEGLGNKFLSNIRECDAIVHVVRCFENDDIIHVEGNINPARDIETINLELILSDVEMLERRIDKTKKMLKGDKKYQKDIDLFERVLDALNEGKPARSVECDDDEKAVRLVRAWGDACASCRVHPPVSRRRAGGGRDAPGAVAARTRTHPPASHHQGRCRRPSRRLPAPRHSGSPSGGRERCGGGADGNGIECRRVVATPDHPSRSPETQGCSLSVYRMGGLYAGSIAARYILQYGEFPFCVPHASV